MRSIETTAQAMVNSDKTVRENEIRALERMARAFKKSAQRDANYTQNSPRKKASMS